MKFFTLKLFVFLFFCFSAFSFSATEPPVNIQTPPATAVPVVSKEAKVEFSKEETEKLNKGEVVIRDKSFLNKEGKAVGSCIAFLIINSQKEEAYKIVKKLEKQVEYMPRVEEIKLEDAAKNLYRYFIKIMIVDIIYYLNMKFDDQNTRMEWALDKSRKNDIKDTTGYWQFHPWSSPRQCLVEYNVFTETGRFVPEFAQNFLMKKDLPGVVQALKKRVESGEKWKK